MGTSDTEDSKECLYGALQELKSLQDYLAHSSTKYFGKLLARLVGVDTIPFSLLTKKGFLSLKGIDINERMGREESFTTNYFRIESVDQDSCCVTVSLLRPFDVYGNDAYSVCEVMKLEKTSAYVELGLSDICAIQPLEVELLKRKIIIEPKC
jgi:Spore coat protein Z